MGSCCRHIIIYVFSAPDMSCTAAAACVLLDRSSHLPEA